MFQLPKYTMKCLLLYCTSKYTWKRMLINVCKIHRHQVIILLLSILLDLYYSVHRKYRFKCLDLPKRYPFRDTVLLKIKFYINYSTFSYTIEACDGLFTYCTVLYSTVELRDGIGMPSTR